ncbi:MAG: OmpH family outer membrane protein [Pseudomonadales bacterium]|nr:OmpH family outer membrane protein [Pseudomonadales bacterium]
MKNKISRATALIAALFFLVATQQAAAHATIGIFDLNRAVFATDAWQIEMRTLEETFQEDQETADSLREELAELMADLETNAPVLSIAEMQRLQEEGQVKQMQLQRIGERVQAALRDSQNAFIERYRTLLGDAINEVYESGGYDLILRSESVVVSGFSYDITPEVTATLNTMIASASAN